jgi:hypothetical protein
MAKGIHGRHSLHHPPQKLLVCLCQTPSAQGILVNHNVIAEPPSAKHDPEIEEGQCRFGNLCAAPELCYLPFAF